MGHLSAQERLRALAALVTAVVLWGSAFVGIRAVVRHYSPGQLSFARLAIASLLLAAIALSRGGVRLPRRADLPRFLLLGGGGQMLYHLLLNQGERTVDAGTASLLVSMAPMAASMLAVAFLGERLSAAGWVGTAVALSGAVAIALGAGASLHAGSGVLLVAIATGLWALFLVVQKSLADRYTSLELTAWPMWIGTVLLVPFAGGLPTALAEAPPAATAGVVFLAVCSSVLGFLAWGYAIQRLPVTVATPSLYCVPLAALLVGFAVLGETPTAASLAGGALAFAGVAIVQIDGRLRAARSARFAEAEA